MTLKFRNIFFHLVLKVRVDFLEQLGHFFIEELTDNSVAYCNSLQYNSGFSTVREFWHLF